MGPELPPGFGGGSRADWILVLPVVVAVVLYVFF
jgi:hypothetical protein